MSAGTGSRSAVGMLLQPHVEEDRLDVRAFLDRLDLLLRLPVRRLVLDGTGERAGVRLWSSSVKNGTARSSGFGSGVSGIVLDPLGHFRGMRLLPVGHVSRRSACRP